MASYPGTIKVFTPKRNILDVVDAGHPNVLQDEVVAMQTNTGINPHVSTPGSGSTLGVWSSSARTYATVSDRLANLEIGDLSDSHTHYMRFANPETVTGYKTFTPGLQLGDSTAGRAASLTLAGGASGGGQASVLFLTDGASKWQMLKTQGDANLYLRDEVNARMQVTYTPGATDTAALTLFGSRVTAISTLTANAAFIVNGLAAATAGTPSTYSVQISQAGALAVLLGATAAEALIQSWSKPLLLNPAGNNVGVGIGPGVALTHTLDVGSTFRARGAAQLDTTLLVTGAATLSSTLALTGLATLSAGATSPASYVATNAAGSSTLGWNDLTFTRAGTSYLTNSNAAGSLSLQTSNAGVNTDRIVIGNGATPTITLANSNLQVNGSSTLTGAATLSSTLAVTGAATLSSTLAVSGISTLTGGLVANGGISTSNGTLTIAPSNGQVTLTQLNSTSIVNSGTATIGSTLGVTGAATFVSTVQFNGDATVLSTKRITFNTAGSSASILGNTDDTLRLRMPQGGLYVVNNADTTLRFQLTDAGAMTVPGPISAGGTLGVTGATTLAGALQVNNTVTATGAGSFQGVPIGNAVTSGFFYDGVNTAVRASATGGVYLQPAGGATSFASFTPSGANIGTSLTVSGTLSPTGALLMAANQLAQSDYFADRTNTKAFLDFQVAGFGARIVNRVTTNHTFAVYGAAAQTADLQQWLNSAGTVVARMDINGAFTTAGAASYGAGIAVTGQSSFTAASAGQLPLYVRGAAGQTQDLLQFQNTAGTTSARVDKDGNFRAPTYQNAAGDSSYFNMGAGGILAISRQIGNATFGVRAIASQTADMQQWQDSAGAVLASVTSGGVVYAPTVNGGTLQAGTTVAADKLNIGGITFAPNGSAGARITTSGGEWISRWYMRSDSGGTPTTVLTDPHNIDLITLNGTTNITPGAAGQIGLIVYGKTSQSADLQQWRTSSGFVGALVGPTGNMGIDIGANGQTYIAGSPASGARFTVSSGSSGSTAVVVRGVASQTQDLLQFQNSGGTSLARIGKDGNILASINDQAASLIGSHSSGLDANSGLSISYAGQPGVKHLVVRAAPVQTANVTEWQNSSGTALTSVSASGRLFATGVTSNNDDNGFGSLGVQNSYTTTFSTRNLADIPVQIKLNTGQTSDLFRTNSATGVSLFSITAGQYVNVNGGMTVQSQGNTPALLASGIQQGTIPIVARGVVGQSADIQQWQDGNSVVQGRVTSDARSLYMTGRVGSGSNTAGVFAAGVFGALNAAETGVVVRGFTSQTGTLQEWQNSAGTQLAAVIATGRMVGNNGGYFLSSNAVTVGLRAETVAAAHTPFEINGIGGQTANLADFRVNGVALSGVGSDGSYKGPFVQNATATGSYLSLGGGSLAVVGRTNVSNTVLDVKGMTGQGGDLLSMSNTGEAFNRIRITPAGRMSLNGWYDTISAINGTFLVSNYAASAAAEVIQGFGSVINVTTKALTNNVATLTLASASNAIIGTRVVVAGVDVTFNGTYYVTAVNNAGPFTLSYSRANADIASVAATGTVQPNAQTGDLTQWRDGSGSVVAHVLSRGEFRIFGSQSSTFGLSIEHQNGSTPPLLIKAAGGQSANFTEWQNSSGTTLTLISAAGGIQVRAATASAFGDPGGSAYGAIVGVNTTQANVPGIIVRGFASQSSDLQTWQDVNGTALARVTAGGSIVGQSYTSTNGNLAFYSDTASNPSGMIRAGSSTLTALSLRGVASGAHTGNLVEFQDSTGVLGWVSGNGLEFILRTNTAAPAGGSIDGPILKSQARTWNSAAGDSLATGGIGMFTVSSNANPPTTALGFYVQNSTSYNGPLNRVGYITNTGALWALSFNSTSTRDSKSNVQPLILTAAAPRTSASVAKVQHKSKTLLDRVRSLKPVSYNQAGMEDDTVLHSYVAEDAAKVVPEVVSFDSTGTPKGINVMSLSVLAMTVVQHLLDRVDALESQLAKA